jgi:hypothetical protein
MMDCFDDTYVKTTDKCHDEFRALVICEQGASLDKCVEQAAKLKECFSRIAKS